ncbi:uncharacterized protein M421DRAFT_8576 [Didymella exigua CBS 183.55]|uniref:Uncharacterized protein n=1 Tax=Didymella exigua CBS 183.55 TaxID=1150837 RepID=A0A6A5RB11_9PLEO|nr:uncharacterized protein M421DRAFT_8576 [Didymella exigua CBS 183.55]KAF1924713.1 hypothetical protein M421DRAFT_8576 [Didymella exigua CBS 183.55]
METTTPVSPFYDAYTYYESSPYSLPSAWEKHTPPPPEASKKRKPTHDDKGAEPHANTKRAKLSSSHANVLHADQAKPAAQALSLANPQKAWLPTVLNPTQSFTPPSPAKSPHSIKSALAPQQPHSPFPRWIAEKQRKQHTFDGCIDVILSDMQEDSELEDAIVRSWEVAVDRRAVRKRARAMVLKTPCPEYMAGVLTRWNHMDTSREGAKQAQNKKQPSEGPTPECINPINQRIQ